MTQPCSRDLLKKLVDLFIPRELIPSDWTCSSEDPLVNIQSLLDKSSGKQMAIKMYGTAENTLQLLKSAVDFPGSSKAYSLPESFSEFSITPLIFANLKGQPFVYKNGYFSILRKYCNLSPDSSRPLEAELSKSIISIFLQEKEELLTKNNEMAPLKDADVEELERYLRHFTGKFKDLLEENLKDSNAIIKLERVVTENQRSRIQKLLKDFSSRVPIEGNTLFYTRVHTWSGLVKGALTCFMNRHPEYFMANQDLEPSQRILTVRLFKEGSINYVMAHELLEVMKIGGMDTLKVEMEIGKMKKLGVFEFRKVFELVGADMKKIEFIAFKRISSQYSVTLTPSFNGEGHCLLATEVFKGLIHNLFNVKRIAQRYDWQYIRNFFENVIGEFFDTTEHQGIYFIEFEDIKRIDELRDSYFSDRSKSITDYKYHPNHVTMEDLKNEVEHLKLSNVFEEISVEVDGLEANGSFFKSHYAFSALEVCQLRCLLRRLPKISLFLHHQKACEIYEFWFSCTICRGLEFIQEVEESLKNSATSENLHELEEVITVSDEVSAIDEEKVPAYENLHELEEVSAIDDEATTSNSSVTDPEDSQGTFATSEASHSTELSPLIHEPTTSDSSSEPVIEKQQKKKKKSKKTKKAPVEVQNEKKPEEKESQCCQKCFRTSEICQKAQKDVKILKIKNKKLENENQKLKEDFEKQMEQKDAEIEMLRKLLAASKTQPEESKEPEEEELGDLECLICHDDMDDIKDTLKCQNCCRRYHKDCLVGWFEKSRSCPVCDSEFEEGIEN